MQVYIRYKLVYKFKRTIVKHFINNCFSNYVGPLLASIVGDLKRKRDGLLTRTVHYYSSHDTTVAPLMLLLGVFDDIAPPYCATILIELRQKDNDYIVTVSSSQNNLSYFV